MAKLRWKKPKGAKGTLEEKDKTAPEEQEQGKGPEQAEAEKAEESVPEEAAAEAKAESTVEEAQGAQKEATIAEWEAALRTAVAQRDEYLQLAQRTQADFSNFRRRNEKVRTDALEEGSREALAAFLPVKDNFERALAAMGDDASNSVADGVRMIYRQFAYICLKLGLEEVPAEPGTPFDPEIHNAVMRGEGGEPDTILECFAKGYRIKGKIVRYAQVKVSAE